MTSQTSSPSNARSPRAVTCEQFVDRQLARVQAQVRLSDLAGRCMGLAVFAIGLVLMLIVLDHWVADLGLWGRWLGLATLAVGCLAYLLVYVVPDFMRKINPAYAAWLVERSEPTLKSSLINLVFLRPQRSVVREVVFREVEQQAAQRLSRVEVDGTVDHTPVIRMAAALMAVLILFAGYTLLSPKSPFQTLARILRPMSDISRPTRVTIRDVQPGSTNVLAGRPLEVSAIIESASPVDSAWLVYSTLDQQIREQRVALIPDRAGLRYSATLPESPTAPESQNLAIPRGVERDLEYFVVAGDAQAGPFQVKVSMAPTIAVEEIQYQYPAYTKIPATAVLHHGDISAVEGTRVTIVARANQEIAVARVEWGAPGEGAAESDAASSPTSPPSPRMDATGRTASYSFVLTLDEKGVAKTQDYRLRFTSISGDRDDRPVRHQIRVLPDLAPEIDIVAPEKRRMTLPLDGRLDIDLRAFDPDFGLSDLRLQMEVDRERKLDLPLLQDTDSLQATGRYEFRPAALDLKVGDRVAYRGRVKDNRHEPLTGEAAPNIANSAVYIVEITAPSSTASDAPGDPQPGDDGATAGQDDRGGPESPDRGAGSPSPQGRESGQPDGQSGESGSEGSAGAPSDEPQSGDDGPSTSGLPPAQEGGGSDGRGENPDAGQDGGQESNAGPGQDAPTGENPGEPRESTDPSGGDQPQAGGDAASAERHSEDGGAGSEESDRPEGQDPAAGGAPGGDPSAAANGGQETTPGEANDAPLPSDGSADPDAFDRILEHMREQLGESRDGLPRSKTEQNSPSKGSSETTPDPQAATQGAPPGATDPTEQERGAPSRGANASDPAKRPGEEKRDGTSEGPEGNAANGGAAPESRAAEPGASSDGADGDDADDADVGDDEARRASPDQVASTDPREDPDSRPAEGDTDPSGGGQTEERGRPRGSDGDAHPADGLQGARNGDQPAGAPPPTQEDQDATEADPSGEPVQPTSPSDGSGASQGGEGAEGAEGAEGESTTEGGPQTAGSSAGGDARQGSLSGTSPTGDDPAIQGGDVPPEPGGDAPNLEYARKATTMALEYLRDQPKPERELLDRLGWTEEQLAEFVRRWEELRASSDEATGARGEGRSAWQEALESLGLHPGRGRMRRAEGRDDGSKGMIDAGSRSQPPAEYREQFEAFRRGVARPERRP